MKRHLVVTAASLMILVGCGQKGGSVEAAKAPQGEEAAAPVTTSAQAGANGEVTMKADAPELKEMKIEAVSMRSVPADAVTATARIEANPHNVGHALAPVAGRITNVAVRLGDTVKQGQVVATIESAAIEDAESDYLVAETAIHQSELAEAKADADLVRLTDLYEHMAVAQKEVLAAQTTLALTKTALEQAKQVRDHERDRLEYLGLKPGAKHQKIVVTAPISGKVTEVTAVQGEYRNEINVPLVTITDLSHVWATAEIPESKIRLCKVGGVAQLELIAYPNEVFRARVTRIADAVNSDTRTIKVNAELENPEGKLRPDMFGNVQYAGGETKAPWIPENAVVRVNGNNLVFVEQTPGRFRATEIEIGPPHEDGFPVVKGLKPGDRIVTQGAIYLKAAL
jgi:membrane fusion protein, heavy metal efflux system